MKFKFDKKIKSKEYSSKYFINTQEIFKKEKLGKNVTLRFFHFQKNVCVCGVEECLQLLKFAISKQNLDKLNIYYVVDGTITNECEPVLIIQGNYKYFGHLENIIDSILSRRSSIATNCREYLKVVGSKKILFMADRSDDYLLQKYDGYAAYIGGIRHFCTKQHLELISDYKDIHYSGTTPHALIQQFGGDVSKAMVAYKKHFPKEKITALVDFNNDCVSEIHKLAHLNFKISYIRIDTSNKLVDKSLQTNNWKNNKSLYGVNEKLIWLCRKELDKSKMHNTQIIVSSGLNLEKIKEFEENKVPIDVYGIGKSLLNINVNFTGDLIKDNNHYFAKVGRDEDIDHIIKTMKKL